MATDNNASGADDAITAVKWSDEGGWNALIERYQPIINSVCRRYRLKPEDAADVSQTVWMKVVDNLDRIREPRAIPAWIKTTAQRAALTVLRSRYSVLSPAVMAIINNDSIIFHTVPAVRSSPALESMCVFEIDETDEFFESDWSVVVVGRLEPATDLSALPAGSAANINVIISVPSHDVPMVVALAVGTVMIIGRQSLGTLVLGVTKVPIVPCLGRAAAFQDLRH
jgi:RNA polymerase sigma factor (sigma-70 family)